MREKLPITLIEQLGVPQQTAQAKISVVSQWGLAKPLDPEPHHPQTPLAIELQPAKQSAEDKIGLRMAGVRFEPDDGRIDRRLSYIGREVFSTKEPLQHEGCAWFERMATYPICGDELS
ncbi:MAG: hypothetical protein Q8K82_11635, partial [Gemmatimonadaceae bacterium]|nr:hypothetical protein [Gemmatimonadaceae bacterium]